MESMQWLTLPCPYCGEPFHTAIEALCDVQDFVEDCQICCRPIRLVVGYDPLQQQPDVKVLTLDEC
ncbi:CPXCG motif-containing cysteine-rich protein [Zooshikella marina]|uniref:CPXCG motif-containing cysteine-rich protein n=1 Tax=Zooshikella ganghwensis TaxID=202772 RepID=UPI001BB01DB0|nr:CPXCG motif-containing cysteine-rich protein [Zooshikella ganghwensis]MBU2704855.1 CPXCG motif-containing cysteine-rich protein [Zooshikella ganghwensis]